MSDGTNDIDWIVSEVVRRLHSLNLLTSNQGIETDERQTAAGKVLHVADRVVTMAHVERRLSGVEKLVVPRQAVVTPAVHDALRAEQIVLIREDGPPRENTAGPGGPQRFVVASDEPTYTLKELSQHSSFHFESISPGDLTTQLQQMADSIGLNGRHPAIGLFVTKRPHFVACAANRRPVIRAAVVGDAAEATEARQTLDANLFVVRPATAIRLQGVFQAAIG